MDKPLCPICQSDRMEFRGAVDRFPMQGTILWYCAECDRLWHVKDCEQGRKGCVKK